MLSDVEIAQQATPKHIRDIAAELGLQEEDLIYYGTDKAKVSLSVLQRSADRPKGRLILVTAITPTPAGEGKTTTTVGLGDALRRLGKSTCIALREPSLGPCFGVKGGAAGGGYAQVIPMADINLHFTGDFHAITTAHNLLAAMLDNHLHQGNALDIDINTITWKRVLDMNERALRDIVIGLGGKANGVPRQSGFEITTASEIMALLCLSRDRSDLQDRLARIVVALNKHGQPVTAKDLGADGAMSVVLKDAIIPNLVQTLEGTPAFVHGGPFGNIAHGCNSIIASQMALSLADYVVTEAGFGSDLGAEKFFNIKCRTGGFTPVTAVVVATIRALKMHGGVPLAELSISNPAAVERGIANLEKHCENVRSVGLEPIVAINKFPTDTDDEINMLADCCAKMDVRFALSDVWARGGEGGLDLAELVLAACENESAFHPVYPLEMPLVEKVAVVARTFYGADDIILLPTAKKRLREIEELGFGHLPVCIAKTQNSLSDDKQSIGRPQGFHITVRDAKVCAGAGFVVIYAGDIMTMPGLPTIPAATKISIAQDGQIRGLF
ncbi:MAG TPA: formate--tetrahydrofolate ligase [Armatimonadota bacterium]|nr:formate--tetrahydrofolate ligase [Armatimonadota bacterium]